MSSFTPNNTSHFTSTYSIPPNSDSNPRNANQFQQDLYWSLSEPRLTAAVVLEDVRLFRHKIRSINIPLPTESYKQLHNLLMHGYAIEQDALKRERTEDFRDLYNSLQHYKRDFGAILIRLYDNGNATNSNYRPTNEPQSSFGSQSANFMESQASQSQVSQSQAHPSQTSQHPAVNNKRLDENLNDGWCVLPRQTGARCFHILRGSSDLEKGPYSDFEVVSDYRESM